MAIMDSTAPKPTTTPSPSDEPAKPDLDLTGQTLGDYRVLRRLGQGGMGQVYLAEQLSLKRKVALKLLRPEMASNPRALQRFKREAEAVARITHANIVQVYQIDEANGLQFMALEYVEGRNLREHIERKGTPDVLLALSIMRQVAAALQRASEMGIIHRDIKPENILLTRKGEVKVADFGLSLAPDGDQPAPNLTQSGVTMGTPLYMSPEQVEGKPVDFRTDIYSFGVTSYYMLAGQPPFRGTTAFEVAVAHVQKEPEPLASIRPDLPQNLCAVVHKMLAKDPNQRYQTGRDLLKDLVRLRESLSGSTLARSPALPGTPSSGSIPALSSSATVKTQPTATLGRRRWALVTVFLLSVLLAAGGGAVFGWWRYQASLRPTTAVTPADTTAVEALFSLQRREQALAQAAEQYLNPSGGYQNIPTGLGVCIDLALFYLDNDRLEEAEKFFDRLEEIKQVRSYQSLGKLGRGIVLSLRSRPQEGNSQFRDYFTSMKANAEAKPAKGNPENQILQNTRLRYWVAEALVYNKKNGLVDPELVALLPGYLKSAARQ
jgi:serine/threonine-protein kinase